MNKKLLPTLVIASFVTASPIAESANIDASFSGLFTMLSGTGVLVQNASYPYYGDTTWGYGLRTQVSGSIFLIAKRVLEAPLSTLLSGLIIPLTHIMSLNLDFQAIDDGQGGQGFIIICERHYGLRRQPCY